MHHMCNNVVFIVTANMTGCVKITVQHGHNKNDILEILLYYIIIII